MALTEPLLLAFLFVASSLEFPLELLIGLLERSLEFQNSSILLRMLLEIIFILILNNITYSFMDGRTHRQDPLLWAPYGAKNLKFIGSRCPVF